MLLRKKDKRETERKKMRKEEREIKRGAKGKGESKS